MRHNRRDALSFCNTIQFYCDVHRSHHELGARCELRNVSPMDKVKYEIIHLWTISFCVNFYSNCHPLFRLCCSCGGGQCARCTRCALPPLTTNVSTGMAIACNDYFEIKIKVNVIDLKLSFITFYCSVCVCSEVPGACWNGFGQWRRCIRQCSSE